MLDAQSIPATRLGVYGNGQTPPGKTAKILAGQFIARATVRYPSWRRADDALAWLRGELQIKATVKQATTLFRVNAPQLKAARERLEQHEQSKRHRANGSGTALSEDAVERIVAEVGVDRIRRAIDRLTEPELPLVAAE